MDFSSQVFLEVIYFPNWGLSLWNVSGHFHFFLISFTCCRLSLLRNIFFLCFLAFNLYVSSLYTHLSLSVSGFVSLLKQCFLKLCGLFFWLKSSGANILQQFLIIFKNFLFQFILQASWAHNHCWCWEMFPWKSQVSILLFWTSCCLHKTRVTKSMLLVSKQSLSFSVPLYLSGGAPGQKFPMFNESLFDLGNCPLQI